MQDDPHTPTPPQLAPPCTPFPLLFCSIDRPPPLLPTLYAPPRRADPFCVFVFVIHTAEQLRETLHHDITPHKCTRTPASPRPRPDEKQLSFLSCLGRASSGRTRDEERARAPPASIADFARAPRGASRDFFCSPSRRLSLHMPISFSTLKPHNTPPVIDQLFIAHPESVSQTKRRLDTSPT